MQATELLQRIESNRAPLILDTRSEIEFKRGHIKGAVNVPMRKLLLHAALLPPNKDREVVVTCEDGQRAAIAKALLSLYGYNNSEFLEGFLEAWKKAGLPLQGRPSILAVRPPAGTTRPMQCERSLPLTRNSNDPVTSRG
jgi:phage shock protein E